MRVSINWLFYFLGVLTGNFLEQGLNLGSVYISCLVFAFVFFVFQIIRSVIYIFTK